MTSIRVAGPPDFVNQIVGMIKKTVPDIVDEKQYNSDYVRGDIIGYMSVLEPNQVIAGNLKDYQVIEFCRDWRSKSQVAKYFNLKFEAAEEILERLTDSGDLVRTLNDSGAKRHHHYEYIDAQQTVLCKDCAYCRKDPKADDDEYATERCYCQTFGGRWISYIDEPRVCPNFLQKGPEEGVE